MRCATISQQHELLAQSQIRISHYGRLQLDYSSVLVAETWHCRSAVGWLACFRWAEKERPKAKPRPIQARDWSSYLIIHTGQKSWRGLHRSMIKHIAAAPMPPSLPNFKLRSYLIFIFQASISWGCRQCPHCQTKIQRSILRNLVLETVYAH